MDEPDRMLIQVARNLIVASSLDLTDDDIDKLMLVIAMLIKNPSPENYRKNRDSFYDIMNYTSPIDTVYEILNISKDPLPPVKNKVYFDARKPSRPWTREEDLRLVAGIHKFGTLDWNIIAAFIGANRSKQQVCQRWNRCLDPSISHDKWIYEDIQKLIELVDIYGKKNWKLIAEKMGNRSDVQCRYQYKQYYKMIEKKKVEKHGKKKKLKPQEHFSNQNENDSFISSKSAIPRVGYDPLPLDEFLRLFI